MIQDQIDYSHQILQWEKEIEVLKQEQLNGSAIIANEKIKFKSKSKISNKRQTYSTKKSKKDWNNKTIKRPQQSNNSWKSKAPKKAILKFQFDPNTLSKDSLRLLGFESKVIQNILKYRSSGGKFYKADDLSKIYGIQEADFLNVKSLINIPKTKYKSKNDFSFKKHTTPSIIDINTAKEEDWMNLKGIGPFYADKIIAFREKLGGFYNTEQVGETWALPDSVFEKIQPYLKLEMPVQKININEVSSKELAAHPYINWKTAGIIKNYIQQHGPLIDKDGLYKIRILDSAKVNMIHPYFNYKSNEISALNK
jgi:competence ComEA-like helix-hairpin-helix protein